jgi:hypothetical protein
MVEYRPVPLDYERPAEEAALERKPLDEIIVRV